MSDDLKEFGFEPLEEFGFEPIEEVEESESEVLKTLQDFSQGVAQGSTFGFFDELAGKASELADPILSRFATGSVDKSLEEQGFDIQQDTDYETERDRFRQAYKTAEERSPLTTLMGELAGGTVPAVTSISGISNLVAKNPLIKKLVEKQGEGAVHTLLSKVLPKALEVGAVGATEGALFGAGQSEAEDVEGISKDALEAASLGGIAGGVLGGGAQAASSTLKKIGSKLDDLMDISDFSRGIKKSYETGKEGLTTVHSEKKKSKDEIFDFLKRQMDTKTDERISDITGDAYYRYKEDISDLSDRLLNLDDKLSSDVGKTLLDAEAKGLKTIAIPSDIVEDVNQFYSKVIKKPFNPEEMFEEFSPTELKDIKNTIYNAVKAFGNQMGGLTEGQVNIQELGHRIDSLLKDAIPEYRDTSSKLYNYRKNVLEKAISPRDPRFKFASLGSDENKKAVLSEALDREYIAPSFLSNMETRHSEDIGKSIHDYLLKTDPDNVKVLGFDSPEQFKDYTSELSDLYNSIVMSSKNPSLNPQKGTIKGTLIESAVGYGKAAMGTGANVAGLVQHPSPKQFLPKIIKKGASIFTIPKDQMVNVGNMFTKSDNPTVKKYGQNLMEAIQRDDSMGTKAALFVMMQNPETRQLIKDITEE